MNILIPHSWLLEHLETTATPQEIQKFLSLSGPSVERIHEIEGEPVYDIEVTTNRVDSMSVRGIAREAAVILSQAGIESKLKPVSFSKEILNSGGDSLPLPRILNDAKLCKRTMCMVIEIPGKKAAPEFMQKRLKQIEVNTHDAVIDITNYVTHELGHPCHAFDYDKIMKLGGVINIKKAEKGKPFITLDGAEYKTVGGEVVYENDNGEIIDLPGIKGTANTAMSDDTKRVLFWIESVDPKSIRFASMTHAIRTVAAQLNEKSIDPHLVEDVFQFGVKLLLGHAGGKIISDLYDDFPNPEKPKAAKSSLEKITTYLGITLPPKRIDTILTDLGCDVEYKNEEFYVVPPTFRKDIEIDVDIIEEIARIYGYHNLPSTLMATSIPTNKPKTENFVLEQEVKEFFATLGAYEVYTYSLIDEQTKQVEANYIDPQKNDTHVKLSNALTEDLLYLRRTLWASHVRILEQNPSRKEFGIFEFANVYIPTQYGRDIDWNARMKSASKDHESKVLPFEEFHLTLTGRGDVRYLKGMIEALAKKYFLKPLRYVPSTNGPEVEILSGETKIGNMLERSGLSIFDLDWRVLLTLARKYPMLSAESKFTAISEDLTFTIPESEQIQRVMESIKESASQVTSVAMKDIYKRNVTFAITYNSEKNQLTSEDATSIRKKIVETVGLTHNTKLVGTIQ